MTALPDLPTPTDLYGLARRLLDLVVEGFTTRDVDLPARRYVSYGGETVYDDAQLTVHVAHMYAGRPGADIVGPGTPYDDQQAVMLVVTIVRPVPSASETMGQGVTPLPPSVDAIQNAALVNLTDLTTLWDVLQAVRGSHELVGPGVPFAVPQVINDRPSGGVGGVVGYVNLSIV